MSSLQGASSNLHDYGFKAHADAVAGIAKELEVTKIIVGGHDWGGAVIFRIAQWHPDLVSHLFSVCTPYFKVHSEYLSTETIIQNGVPQFGYQLQLGSEDQKVEKVVNSEARIRKFLLGAYGGKPKSGKVFMTGEKGIDLDLIENDEFEMTPLLDKDVGVAVWLSLFRCNH